jgi:hypothetical protein
MTVRKKRKHDKKEYLERRRLDNKRRLEEALAALGLIDGFRALSALTRNSAIDGVPPKPVVRIDPAAGHRPALEDVKDSIKVTLETPCLKGPDGTGVSPAEALTTYLGVRFGFASLNPELEPQKHRPFLAFAKQDAAYWHKELAEQACDELSFAVKAALESFSRCDRELVACTAEAKGTGFVKVLTLTLSHSGPREAFVDIDGVRRRVYQVGVPQFLDGVQWLEVDGGAFGLESGRALPVYVQSHALNHLEERLPPPAVPTFAARHFLSVSLREPNVVDRQGGAYLIEYRLCGHRVGYLVGRVLDGKLVIVTFLFLTMQGTPEARLLRERLRLSRRDIEHERLDRIETFLGPDVRGDSQLVPLLEACGCGSLLAVVQEADEQPGPTGIAESLKRFLGLNGRDGARKLQRLLGAQR